MDFSLFDEASRDYDAEAAERRTAEVRVAVQEEVLPFLALARTQSEYTHRKALVQERLTSIARRSQASVEETGAMADRLFAMIAKTRQGPTEASMRATATMKCSNCGHGSVDHSEGLRCGSCGCNDFTPASRTAGKEARRVTAEEGQGPFS